ncbi:MAG: signal peptidase II [Anaeromyxobacteraceae bacterium]
MKRPASRWSLLAAIFVVGVGLDQWTKYLAVARLTDLFGRVGAETPGARLSAFLKHRYLEAVATEPYYVFRPMWRMLYVENPNAAFGLGRFLSDGPRLALFLVAAGAAAVAVVYYFRQLAEDQRFHQVALALVLAGDLGNFVDRATRQYVIDFIDWYWWNRPDLRWPTFNVADSMLVVGVAMLLLKPFPSKGEAKAGGKG